MKCSIKYSPIALRDLDRVKSEVFEASKDQNITSRYMNDLLDKIEAKRDFPLSGSPLYYKNLFTGYYIVIFKSYLAFYRFDNNTIYVDRILYGKSDYIRTLRLPNEDTETDS